MEAAAFDCEPAMAQTHRLVDPPYAVLSEGFPTAGPGARGQPGRAGRLPAGPARAAAARAAARARRRGALPHRGGRVDPGRGRRDRPAAGPGQRGDPAGPRGVRGRRGRPAQPRPRPRRHRDGRARPARRLPRDQLPGTADRSGCRAGGTGSTRPTRASSCRPGGTAGCTAGCSARSETAADWTAERCLAALRSGTGVAGPGAADRRGRCRSGWRPRTPGRTGPAGSSWSATPRTR